MTDPEYFILARLEEFFADMTDPWGSGFEPLMLDDETIEPVPHPYTVAVEAAAAKGEPDWDLWSAQLHAGRIRYLMTSEGDLQHPIVIDCLCNGGYIYPEPLLIDGWHRYMAHRALKSERVPVSFGGLLSLAKYLRGETNVCPED